MKKEPSTNNSAIEMTQMFLDDFCSRQDVIAQLKIKPATFFKNLQLLNAVGFDIEKERKNYRIISFCEAVKMTKLNTSIMAHLALCAEELFPENKLRELILVFKKFLFLASKKDYRKFLQKYNFYKKAIVNCEYRDKIELFYKFLIEKKILKVAIKNKGVLKLLPVRFMWKNEGAFFVFQDTKTKEMREYNPQDVLKMQFYQRQTTEEAKINQTVFELSGRLAKTYVIKEDEELIDTLKDRIIIGNHTQDKQKLFKRLLRYDTLCTVTKPRQDVVAFQELIKKSLDNINEIQDNISK